MKKFVMLSAAAILGLSSIALSQAETNDAEATEAAVAVTEADVVQEVDAEQTVDEAVSDDAVAISDEEMSTAEQEEAADEEVAAENVPAAEEKPKEEIPQDPPQVRELIEQYPNLVQRIEPYAKVCFEGEQCDITLTASGGSADGEPRDGEAVYNQICQTCHTGGLLGSPKLGDAGAWGPRIAKGKETLYNHAINGFNAMPAKGGADIPDEEVKNAVDYMIEQGS